MKASRHFAILGIDPGLAYTGWGLIQLESQFDKPVHVAHGVIKTLPKEPTLQRVSHIASELHGLIRAHAPNEVAVEAYRNYGRVLWNGVQTLYTIGALVGAAHVLGHGVCEYSAKECKAGVGVTDGAKASVRAALPGLLAFCPEIRNEHAADALAVALTHLGWLRASTRILARRGVDVFGNADELTIEYAANDNAGASTMQYSEPALVTVAKPRRARGTR